ncbi:MAG: hypothetical protein E6J26_05715 [Chloroflexi bacterium]|nr:MAG: hypothetical protein E6J26_05715 [Chloroflexota bacterium]
MMSFNHRSTWLLSLLVFMLGALLGGCDTAPATPAPNTQAPTTQNTLPPTQPPPPPTQPPAPNTPAPTAQPTSAAARNPTHSSPVALTSDDATLLVANPLNGTVTIVNVKGDANQKLAEVKVGVEPQSVAIAPDDKTAYVTNQGSASVSVIDIAGQKEVIQIKVGVEPYGVAFTPDGARAYVVNGASRSVSVIDAKTQQVSATIKLPIVGPRAVAITANNNGAGPQFVYVTQFLSQEAANGKEMNDSGKEGKVIVLSTADDQNIQGTIILAPHDTGFTADRSAFGGTATDPTSAFPNQMQSVVLKNGKGYLPNIASGPQAPVRFDVDTQAFLSVFDTASKAELPGHAQTVPGQSLGR